MKVNTSDINLNGSTFVGVLVIDYSVLLSLFGKPRTTDDKVSCVWDIEFDDGVVASIYIWKPGKNDKTETTTEWNIGGWYESKDHVIDYISSKL